MAFPEAMMHETVWFDKLNYDEAEDHYQLFLTNNLSAQLYEKHCDKADGIFSQVTQVAAGAGSAIINEIAKARDSIKQALSGMAHQVSHAVTAESDANITQLKSENKELLDLADKLSQQVSALEIKNAKLEGGTAPVATTAAAPAAKKNDEEEDDDDMDLFGSDDEEDEEEEKKRKEELVKKYHEKKASKKQVIAKSTILIDVKPWSDETDMQLLEKSVRTIEMDGLVWGTGKLLPIGYGIKKLQIMCVIEDDKVCTEDLEEAIVGFEELVQSMDIAAFNKV